MPPISRSWITVSVAVAVVLVSHNASMRNMRPTLYPKTSCEKKYRSVWQGGAVIHSSMHLRSNTPVSTEETTECWWVPSLPFP